MAKSRRKKSSDSDSAEMKELAMDMGLMTMGEKGHPAEQQANEVPTEIPEPRSEWLSRLRADTVNAQVRAAHTIAELEAWRNEIDATIAFLKTQRK